MYSRKKEQQCVYKPLERSYVPDLNKLAYLEAPHEQLRLTVAKLEKEFFESRNGMSNLSDSFESLDRKSPEKQLNESSVAGALRQSESMKRKPPRPPSDSRKAASTSTTSSSR